MIAALAVQKPRALKAGSRFAVVSPASPGHADAVEVGARELQRLGFSVAMPSPARSEGYFAAAAEERRREFLDALREPGVDGLVATRGGYGSVYLLDAGLPATLPAAKILLGFSDLTTLQIYLWQRHRWTGFYGPMLSAGLNYGAGEPGGYDQTSLENAIGNTSSGWPIALQGEILIEGSGEGVVLGGAMTLLESAVGTAWELDTDGAILVLEDRAMKPYQIDRVLMHLKLSGKLAKVRGIVLGDFPDCEPPVAGSPTVQEVASRILGPLGVPVVFGSPVGHTRRPMLTIPLGVRGRLQAKGSGTLEILEPAVTE
jgi:muramoyltetrapeptide carboxypeptidase